VKFKIVLSGVPANPIPKLLNTSKWIKGRLGHHRKP
jgi:hypothetical protein